MQRLGATVLGVVFAVPSAWAADMPTKAPPAAPAEVVREASNVQFASEARYYSWKGDRGSPPNFNGAPGSGSQWYVPFALQVTGKPVDVVKAQFLVRSGWVRSSQTTPGQSGTVETITDTVLSGSWTYLGIGGVQPFVALSVNAPTGKSALFGTQANARMDPDLVELSTFGEGWNIGPTAGVNIAITGSLMFTASVGYTWRGPFDRERSSAEVNPAVQTATSLDPGDVLTGTLSLGYQDPEWSWNATGTVSEETKTTENGVDLYKAGRRYVASATVARNWPGQWGQTTVNASYAHSNRNEVLFLGAPALIQETVNTNSDLYRVGVQHLFLVDDTLALGPTGSYLHRNNNSYGAGTLQFVPAKERWAVGGLARKALTPNVTFNIRGEYVWVDEDERPASNGQMFSQLANAFVAGSAVPIVSSTGWMVAAGINVSR
ncbi:MAG: hypothetical protein K2Z80_02535 [Xanthobacteraceae bacterium]|nr:hypothetical protein [Xanthobacteraceae bacterium]